MLVNFHPASQSRTQIDDPRIIPLRSRISTTATDLPAISPLDSHFLREPAAPSATHSTRRPDEEARHYLKFMLPAIPVTAFVLTFLYSYLLVGMNAPTTTVSTEVGVPVVDPSLPLLGATLLALATGMLCLIAYLGYQRVAGRALHERDALRSHEIDSSRWQR